MRFCPKCGKAVADDDLFCNECGSKIDVESVVSNVTEAVSGVVQTPVYDNGMNAQSAPSFDNGMNGQPMPSYNQPMVNGQPVSAYNNAAGIYSDSAYAPKKKSKLPVILGIIGGIFLIACIVVAICVAAFGVGSSSPKNVAKNFVKASINFNSKEAKKYMAYTKDNEDEVDEAMSSLDDSKEYIEEYNYKGTVKSVKEVTISKAEKKTMWDDMEDPYVGKKDVSDMHKFVVTYKISMSYLGQSMSETQKLNVYVGKYKGNYKVIGVVEVDDDTEEE